MRDSFGIPIAPGDYILSASTTGGRVKIGRAKQGRNGLLMTIDLSAQYGGVEEQHPATGQLGYNVVVLRKADGTVPEHIGTPPELDPSRVETALRGFLAHLDYDHHKAIECSEDDGEDHYPEVAADFIASYDAVGV